MPPSDATRRYPRPVEDGVDADDRLVEPDAARRSVEVRVAEGEDAAVRRDEPVAVSCRCRSHADDGCVQRARSRRSEEARVAEREHAAVGGERTSSPSRSVSRRYRESVARARETRASRASPRRRRRARFRLRLRASSRARTSWVRCRRRSSRYAFAPPASRRHRTRTPCRRIAPSSIRDRSGSRPRPRSALRTATPRRGRRRRSPMWLRAPRHVIARGHHQEFGKRLPHRDMTVGNGLVRFRTGAYDAVLGRIVGGSREPIAGRRRTHSRIGFPGPRGRRQRSRPAAGPDPAETQGATRASAGNWAPRAISQQTVGRVLGAPPRESARVAQPSGRRACRRACASASSRCSKRWFSWARWSSAPTAASVRR